MEEDRVSAVETVISVVAGSNREYGHDSDPICAPMGQCRMSPTASATRTARSRTNSPSYVLEAAGNVTVRTSNLVLSANHQRPYPAN